MYFCVKGNIRGKQRPRFFKGHAYTPKETKDYEEHIRQSYYERYYSKDIPPSNTRYKVVITAVFRVPESWSKKKKEEALKQKYCTKKPDTDNIIKIVLDALNGIIYQDDKQVVIVECKKYYDISEERLLIEVTEI